MIVQKKIKVESHEVMKVRREFFEETGLRLIIEHMKKFYGDNEEYADNLCKYEKECKEKHGQRDVYAREFLKSRIGDKKILSYVFYFDDGEVVFSYEEQGD